jgi:hypothetical protein
MIFLLDAVVLLLLFATLGRGVLRASAPRALVIALAVLAVEYAVLPMQPLLQGLVLALVLALAVIWLGLGLWCRIAWAAAGSIAVLYVAYRLIVTLVLLRIL